MTTIKAESNVYATCRCGKRVRCTPSTATFGLWQGTGACGGRVEVTGTRTTEPQPRKGLREHYRGGCEA